ncbi:SSWI/SNF chromatin-remodeling complex subunit [Wickerhamomyces ciferrii]|uniref:SSWI/SNF chromatin-remodeling complex subunit n=1 Tax=Wickerhamomyces ciferrii (strain ATCC 14091 / BCRC 22168 / CBS 111 / JCM 3599 / NBRC 0793 / NRRL Y-1031 F-60-10) TaxID=1206466 RepID=K0KDR2_WICCF|nr:SSWI/SNF chromatin-remodeling complex subunit [Wickerhamomyces ciferrii]CCH41061.1 SSWI/SNF chromatin-remodeling complex subunit [Wickerhamomyces ciferrii]
MADQYWLNEQLKNDDGFAANNNSQQDDQLMSSFLNYLDGDNNNSSSGNGTVDNRNQVKNNSNGASGVNSRPLSTFNQNAGSIGGPGSNEPFVDLGVSPSSILSQQQALQQQQNQGPPLQQSPQLQQIQQQQQQNQSQRSSQDANALIQSLLHERNNNQNNQFPQQGVQPQQNQPNFNQNQGLPPNVFSPPTSSQTIPPQVQQQQVPTPQLQQQNIPNQIQNQNIQRQGTPQFNNMNNVPLDKAAMIAALQQRNNQNQQQQQQQQFLQQQMMNQQQQQQQQQQQNSMSPNLNNQPISNQQQQQHMFQQLQQQQALRLQQLQQQQRQQQQNSIGGPLNQTPMSQDSRVNSPMISNQVPGQNQFNSQFSAPNQISRNGTPFQQAQQQAQQQQQQRPQTQPMNMHQVPGSQHPSVPNTPQQAQRVVSNPQQQMPQRPSHGQIPQIPQQQQQQQQAQGSLPGSVPGSGSIPQQNLTPEQIQQRKLQQQLSATQIDLFMKTLTDFMRNRGTPITSPPYISDKRIHLFFFYAIVARLGGSASVSRQQQWPFVAQKLALPVDQNHQVARDLAKIYIDYLLPFEQYAGTPEGQKDLQTRRQNIQKQHEDILRQLKQSQQGQPPQATVQPHQPQQIPSTQPQPTQIPNQPSTQPTPAQIPQHISPQIAQQNINQSQIPTPTQQQFQKANNIGSNAGSNANSPIVAQQHASPYNQQFGGLQQSQRQKSVSQIGSNVNSPLPQQQVPPQATPEQQIPIPEQQQEPPSETAKPNVIRNYVPEQRIIEQHAGYDVKSLNQLGEQIDVAKPIFLFAPELGAVSIHALIMSLDSSVSNEVNTALNTALVTSADSGLTIPLIECPEFLESLASLGLRTLDQLLNGTNSRNVVGVEKVDLENLVSKNSNIDDIFDKYVKDEDDAHEVEIQIDSFSGEQISEEDEERSSIKEETDAIVVDEDGDVDLNNDVTVQNDESRSGSVTDLKIPSNFNIPPYIDMLIAVRHESEHPFSKIHTKSADDPQVLLVDQLTTISMVLRNISFYEHNAASLAANDYLKEFLFKLVAAIASNPEKFIFTRRRLGFVKDVLIILVNISHLLQLRNHNDALLILILVLSFGAEQKSEDELTFAEYNPSSHKYQSHGVDVLAKLLVRDPPNRQLFHEVLSGNYDSNTPFSEVEENKKLAQIYTESDTPHKVLLSKVFKYLISVIPLTNLGLNTIIQERDAAILQSLIASILIIDIVPTEGEQNLALSWLSGPECVGNGLIKLGLVLAAVASKPGDNDALRLISARAFTLVNSLIQKSIEFIDNDDGDLSHFNQTKLQLPSDAVLGALLTSIDPSILNQILTLSNFLKKINSAAVKVGN